MPRSAFDDSKMWTIKGKVISNKSMTSNFFSQIMTNNRMNKCKEKSVYYRFSNFGNKFCKLIF